MNDYLLSLRRSAYAIVTLSALIAGAAEAREVTDMLGRKVTLPDRVERVFTAAPPTALAVYAMARETLVAFNGGPAPKLVLGATQMLDPRVAALPNFGSMMGHGMQADVEQVLAAKPDVVIAWGNSFIGAEPIEKAFAKSGVPVVFLTLEKLDDYAPAFALLGAVFDKPARAAALSAYITDALARVNTALAKLPADKRAKVYYAESPDGLATDCDQSLHAEGIRLARGDNVYHCTQHELIGMERISLEQIVAFQPDYIISQDPAFAPAAAKDPRWATINAVANGQVKTVPRLPFNWLDRPPSYTRALGMQWLANWFYPDLYPVDLKQETRNFYQLFYDIALTDTDLERVLP